MRKPFERIEDKDLKGFTIRLNTHGETWDGGNGKSEIVALFNAAIAQDKAECNRLAKDANRNLVELVEITRERDQLRAQLEKAERILRDAEHALDRLKRDVPWSGNPEWFDEVLEKAHQYFTKKEGNDGP